MAANSPSPQERQTVEEVREGGWRPRLYQRLRGNPYPLFVFSDCIIPAASIWSGARIWAKAFREAGMSPGDRIAVALPPSHAFVQVLVAALWENLTLALIPPAIGENEASFQAVLEELDVVAGVAASGNPSAAIWQPDDCAGPREESITLRPTRFPRDPEARFLLKTSGTTSQTGKWLALSDANVLSVLDSHLPHLGYVERESRVLSVLPWHHCFGLVMDLLPALLSGAEIVRDPRNGRNPEALIALAEEMGSEYLSTVPITIKRIQKTSGGTAFLQNLKGGIVGGAPADAMLTKFLRTTRLRAGYGQTEASPGIALGEPGYWPDTHYLGRVLGCETTVDAQNLLSFRGANAHYGVWNPTAGLEVLDADRVVNTGDCVEVRDNGDLFFRGRADAIFKLANGRAVEAGYWETQIKLAFPNLLETLLWSPDGEQLALFYFSDAQSALPTLPALQEILENLGPRLVRMASLAETYWVRTAKGTINRQMTLASWHEN